MFQLTNQEWTNLKCRIGISSLRNKAGEPGIKGWGGSRVAPYAFTEEVAAMESKYDSQFKVVFDAIRQLMAPPDKKIRRIGFVSSEE